MTSSRNSGWSTWLIYWLRLCSHKQKAPFPQRVTTVDHQIPAPNHSRNVTKVQEVKTSDSSGDVTWQFQCKFPIHLWLIYLTSFLDESSTLRCFTIVKIGRWLIWKHFSLHSVGAVFTSSKSTITKKWFRPKSDVSAYLPVKSNSLTWRNLS